MTPPLPDNATPHERVPVALDEGLPTRGLAGWLYRHVPALGSLRNYSRGDLSRDLMAGLTVATVAVPQAMAYATLAGLPAQYGLYTAIIMTAVFGGFVFSHSAMIRPIGFGLAFGVLVDAFVVRMLIVPSLMHLAGAKAWWLPKWLDRRLPNLDVEGAALERRHPHVQDVESLPTLTPA